MSESTQNPLSPIMQVFISSKTSEMEAYRDKAIEAVRSIGMVHKNYNDPQGADLSQASKSIFENNRDTVKNSDVFVGLYGFGEVWKPAYHPGLPEIHPELLDDPGKLILEYEYEWAQEAGLYTFRFVATEDTIDLKPAPMDSRMARFRNRLMAQNVGWLTTPEAFYNQLVDGLSAIRPRVFLSYSRKNADSVSLLQGQLRHEDILAWRDATSIPGGTDWFKVLTSALDQLDILVVVVTPDSVKSEWVKKECTTFVAQGKTVIPYITDEACKSDLPEFLSRIQWIDGTAADGFPNLVKRLRIVLSSK